MHFNQRTWLTAILMLIQKHNLPYHSVGSFIVLVLNNFSFVHLDVFYEFDLENVVFLIVGLYSVIVN